MTVDNRPLVDRIAQAIGDPGSIAGRKLGPSWGLGNPGYAEQEETVTRWSTRAVLALVEPMLAELEQHLAKHTAERDELALEAAALRIQLARYDSEAERVRNIVRAHKASRDQLHLEFAALRRRLVHGRPDADTITVAELRAALQSGPAPADIARVVPLAWDAHLVEALALAIRARERTPEQITDAERSSGYHNSLDGYREAVRSILRDHDKAAIAAGCTPPAAQHAAAMLAAAPSVPTDRPWRWELQIRTGPDCWEIHASSTLPAAGDPNGLARLIADRHLENRDAQLADTPWRVLVWPAGFPAFEADTAVARVASRGIAIGKALQEGGLGAVLARARGGA